jgi:uncharacterized protein
VTKIEQTFGQKKILLPVIHVDNEAQALSQCRIAVDSGCKGVFLINHKIKHTKLRPIIESVWITFPQLWLGVNYLDLPAMKALEKLPICAKGLWADNAYIDEDKDLTEAVEMWRQVTQFPELMYFGGTAFKHQKPVRNLEMVSQWASSCMDVVTTSGEATGEAAFIGKIAHMKKYIGNTPLGIASGITVENVNEYLPYVDAFLVATGISKSFTELDFEKTKQLNQIINHYVTENR